MARGVIGKSCQQLGRVLAWFDVELEPELELEVELVIWFVKWKPKAESSRVRLATGLVLPAVRILIAVVTVMGR